MLRSRDPPHWGHEIGPLYRADILIVPPLRSILLISYRGRPKTISESVKTLSPKIVLPIWDHGLPPFLIKSQNLQTADIPQVRLWSPTGVQMGASEITRPAHLGVVLLQPPGNSSQYSEFVWSFDLLVVRQLCVGEFLLGSLI